MIGIPYIQEIAVAILKQSKAIKGRCYWAPHGGGEINAGNLDQVIKNAGLEDRKLYPLVLLLPPTVTGDFSTVKGKFLRYPIRALFLKRTFNTTDNRVSRPGIAGTSTHTIPEDWHDMQRCAMEFVRMQYAVSAQAPNVYHIGGKERQAMDYVTTIGTDRVSGVLLTYDAFLATSCEGEEDYDAGALDLINQSLPSGDSHPAHKM